MTKHLLVFLVFVSISLLGCNKCKDVLCFTPPAPFEMEFLDSESKENLITNGSYRFDQIEITNEENGNSINFDTISYENESYIRLTDIGWKTEEISYSIAIPNEFAFTFYVDAERLEGECCNFTRFNEISISTYEYEESTSSERISVFIER